MTGFRRLAVTVSTVALALLAIGGTGQAAETDPVAASQSSQQPCPTDAPNGQCQDADHTLQRVTDTPWG